MFTLIIPIYNTEEYIKDCLDSIKNQTFKDFEVLMMNDGSTDRSLEIIEEYAKTDERFKVVSNPNSGISITRNKGIRMANNPYVVFVDSDDTLNNELLDKLNDEIKENNPDLIRYGVDVIGESDDRRYRFNIDSIRNISGEDAIRDWSLSGVTYALPWVYAIKKDVFIDNDLFFTPGRIHEDYLLMPFLIANSKKVSVIDYVGYNYLLRQGSISLSNSFEKVERNLLHFVMCYTDIVANIDKMNLSDETALIFLNDQHRRLMKEMAKSDYDVRVSALSKIDENTFTHDEKMLIKDKNFNKKSFKKQ